MKKITVFLTVFGLAVGAALAWVTYDCIKERNYNSQPYEKKTDWPEMRLEFPPIPEVPEASAEEQHRYRDISLPHMYNTVVVTLMSGDVHVYYNVETMIECDSEYVIISYWSVQYNDLMSAYEYYQDMKHLDINPQDGRL